MKFRFTAQNGGRLKSERDREQANRNRVSYEMKGGRPKSHEGGRSKS